MSARPPRDVDVVVVGGGAVGLTAALVAHAAGLTVRVLERGADAFTPAGSVGPESRVYALAPASRRLLAGLGAWPVDVPWFEPGPIREMAVYERRSKGALAFDVPTERRDAEVLAHVVPHGMLMRALVEACRREGIALDDDVTIEALEVGRPGAGGAARARIDTDRGASGAALVIGADGARSRMRELAGLTSRGQRYDQHGVTAVLTLVRPHGAVARQHFREGEIVALLPLALADTAVLVWSAGDAHAAELAALDDVAFAAEVEAAFDAEDVVLAGVSDRRAFPLGWSLSERFTCGRLVLVGDAAHTMHPLAGQGLNLGLMDVAALADGVLPALAPGRGDLGVELKRFERWRKSEASVYRLTTDGLFRLFASSPAGVVRGAGMRIVDRLGPLKRHLAARAMGEAGDLPRGVRAPSKGPETR